MNQRSAAINSFPPTLWAHRQARARTHRQRTHTHSCSKQFMCVCVCICLWYSLPPRALLTFKSKWQGLSPSIAGPAPMVGVNDSIQQVVPACAAAAASACGIYLTPFRRCHRQGLGFTYCMFFRSLSQISKVQPVHHCTLSSNCCKALFGSLILYMYVWTCSHNGNNDNDNCSTTKYSWYLNSLAFSLYMQLCACVCICALCMCVWRTIRNVCALLRAAQSNVKRNSSSKVSLRPLVAVMQPLLSLLLPLPLRYVCMYVCLCGSKLQLQKQQ